MAAARSRGPDSKNAAKLGSSAPTSRVCGTSRRGRGSQGRAQHARATLTGANRLELCSKGDAGYGQAPAGSLTEARAKAAQAWVDKEIDSLIEVIEKHGQMSAASGSKHAITFGELMPIYADISDSLVSILKRAKKRKRLTFDADMLFRACTTFGFVSGRRIA